MAMQQLQLPDNFTKWNNDGKLKPSVQDLVSSHGLYELQQERHIGQRITKAVRPFQIPHCMDINAPDKESHGREGQFV